VFELYLFFSFFFLSLCSFNAVEYNLFQPYLLLCSKTERRTKRKKKERKEVTLNSVEKKQRERKEKKEGKTSTHSIEK